MTCRSGCQLKFKFQPWQVMPFPLGSSPQTVPKQQSLDDAHCWPSLRQWAASTDTVKAATTATRKKRIFCAGNMEYYGGISEGGETVYDGHFLYPAYTYGHDSTRLGRIVIAVAWCHTNFGRTSTEILGFGLGSVISRTKRDHKRYWVLKHSTFNCGL